MCVKFGDDPIGSLDFSFIGGDVPLNLTFSDDTELKKNPPTSHHLKITKDRTTNARNMTLSYS